MKVAVIALYPMVRKGIISIISKDKDIEFAGEAASFNDGLKLLEKTKPDVVLVDAYLGAKDGIEFILAAKDRKLLSKFMIMGFCGSEKFISKAIDMGVEGYVLREAYPEEILYGIRQIFRGKRYYDADLIDYIHNTHRDDVPHLTSRETEVLRELAKGLTNKKIANNFYITEHTVKKHVSQILTKLELNDRTQAAIFANSIGLSK